MTIFILELYGSVYRTFVIEPWITKLDYIKESRLAGYKNIIDIEGGGPNYFR